MSALPTDQVKMLDAGIVRSPYGNLLGMELVEAREDHVEVKLAFKPEVTTYGDTVHGGAISALIDVAATASFWATPSIGTGAKGATIGFTVNLISAARGKDLLAVSRVRRRGREISTAEVTVSDPDGRDIALALVTYKLSQAKGDVP